MADSVAIVIGVSRIPGLQPLPGARTGADEFATWARGQGFDVECFNDWTGVQAVRSRDIETVVRAAVDDMTTDRLFIFFAGHGISKGGADFWLLSDVKNYSSEAINVDESVKRAWMCGIRHVAFFADACRTPPESQAINEVVGSPVFPPGRDFDRTVELDKFYATRAGDPAWEKNGHNGVKAFGIFSRCLMRGLRGEEPGVVEPVVGGLEDRAVLARTLRDVLTKTVRIAASREAGVVQRPDCQPGSYWEPNVLAWVPSLPLGRRPSGPGPNDENFAALEAEDRAAVESLASSYERSTTESGYLAWPGPSGPTGSLFVAGAEIDSSLVGGTSGIRRHAGLPFGLGDAPEAALLSFGPSDWATAAILPGFSCVMSISEVGVDHVAYLPISTRPTSLGPEATARAVALATAQMRFGQFDPDNSGDLIQRGLYEDQNPSLAVLAAYQWASAGQFGRVRELLETFISRGSPVPYDIPMLASVRGGGAPIDRIGIPVVPGFPLLTRGWAVAEDADTMEPGVFRKSRAALASATWTTFSQLPIGVADQLVTPVAARAAGGAMGDPSPAGA
jgi:hypothetical protein